MKRSDQVIYESPRHFEVWDWGTGHRGLKLRSNPAKDHSSRIEVWFKPAYVVSLPSSLRGLQITALSDIPAAAAATLGRSLESWEIIFCVNSGSSTGWIVAGGVYGREDDREFHAADIFDGYGLKPGERELF